MTSEKTMSSRAKVVKGLECCGRWTDTDLCDEVHCSECPYNSTDIGCGHRLAADALTMLQEQEPVKTEPVRFRVFRSGAGNYPFWDCVCDGCGFKTSTVHTNWRFCPECGRAVKWDD